MDEVVDTEIQKREQRDMSSEGYETVCWGCGLRLLLPSYVPVFKCGWCGAISSCELQAKKQGRCTSCSSILDRVLVTIILALIILVICGGSWAAFPVLFPAFGFTFYIHVVVTAILSFNTLFNYCIAAFLQAGPLPPIAWGSSECVTKHALEGHRFCHVCKKPKPPRAHHCRACKACVLEMDHHCPFIGNCVGAANQRPFILFLTFSVISNLYVLVMSISALLKIRSSLTSFPNRLQVTNQNWHVLEVVASYLQASLGSSFSSSMRALALLYLVAVSLSVMIGVGLLLHQQLQQLYNGHTFIDSLQFENGVLRGLPPGRRWRNLQIIFGSEHLIFWIFPKLVVDASGNKVHEL